MQSAQRPQSPIDPKTGTGDLFPEVCFMTAVGRKCYSIFSTPTVLPGPVIPSEQIDIGRITGFDGKRQVQFESSIGIDPIDLVPKMVFQAADIRNQNRFSTLKLTLTTEEIIRKLRGIPGLSRPGQEVVSIPYKRKVEDCECEKGERKGDYLGILELLGHKERPGILHIRTGDELSMTWTTTGFSPAALGFTAPDGQPVAWVPWAVAGALAAVCIGAAVYKCGKCTIDIGVAEIGYTCDK